MAMCCLDRCKLSCLLGTCCMLLVFFFCRYVLKRHLLKFEGQYGESEKRFFRLSLYTTEKQKWYDRLFPHF